jgi:hypothetical protein
MRKNNESPLRELPFEKQHQVINWLQNSTKKETAERIAAEFGLKVSDSTVGRFPAWWHMTRSLELAAEFADALRGRLDQGELDTTQRERIREAAQMAFELAAIERQDLAAFVSLRKLRQRDTTIEIARQRCQSATTARDNALSPPSASEWSEQDRQAVIRKVDEVFGISQEPAAQPITPSPPCVQNPPNPPTQ